MQMAENGNDKPIRRFDMSAPPPKCFMDALERRRLRAKIPESSGLTERITPSRTKACEDGCKNSAAIYTLMGFE
jgi:hypothetical protein